MVIVKSVFLALDVQHFLDVMAKINDVFFIAQILSAFVNELEFRWVLEIFGDDKFPIS